MLSGIGRRVLSCALAGALLAGSASVPAWAHDEVSSSDGDADSVAVPAGGASLSWEVVPRSTAAPQPAVGLSGESSSSSVALAGDATRLQVKFHEDSGVVWTGVGIDDREPGSALDAVLSGTPGLVVVPLFTRSPALLAADRDEAEGLSGRPQPDLRKWFIFEVPSLAGGQALISSLRSLSVVEMVQPEPDLALTQTTEQSRQGYLDPAPTGINAEWAWTQPGGSGNRVTLVLIDSGFDTAHADLDNASAPGVAVAHAPPWESHHGLQVLGIVAADDDGQGLRGIASGSALKTINSGRTSGEVANAIDLAGTVAGPGDVVSISQGVCALQGCADGVVLPLVYSSSARDALRVAAARGVITVVSGGNGGANLDNYGSRLGTDAPETIVVGAANPPATADCDAEDGPARGRVSSSNYGSRVDLHGWGACVRTALQGGGYQWWGFTSAATPVVAGAAALVSSMAEQREGVNLSGGQVRAMMQTTGSAQVFSGTRGGSIGPLPDVQGALGALDNIPGSDMFASPVVVDSLPFTGRADTRFAGVELNEPGIACGDISNTVWYSFTPMSDIEVTMRTSGSDFDTLLGLWRLDGPSLTEISCDNDITVNDLDSEVSQLLSAGETYVAQVGGNDGARGRLRFEIVPVGYEGVGCDVDGDGYGDIVSGSPGEDVGQIKSAGRALVHFGEADGRPSRVTSITQEWPGVSGASERGDAFGTAVACGDFDGDGFDDVAVGGPKEDTKGRRNTGAVRVIPGSELGLARSGAQTITQSTPGIAGKPEAGDRFGGSLAVGDFDGDGFDDLAIGAKGEDIGSIVDAGAVHVLYGSATGAGSERSVFLQGNTLDLPNVAEPGDKFGATLAAGDFDQSGFDDLVIGSPSEDIGTAANAGAVFVLRGDPAGVLPRSAVVLHQNVEGIEGEAQVNDRFGRSLGVGDIDGDNFDDLVVGAPGERVGSAAGAGIIHLFGGSVFGLSATESTILHQNTAGVRGTAEAGDSFGSAVTVGDLTGDGFDDLAVGAPGEAVGPIDGAGLVHVLSGGPAGLDTEDDQVVTQNSKNIGGKSERNDHLAASLTNVDLDGDARRDLVVGVPDEDISGKVDVGYMLLVPGSEGGVKRSRATGLTQFSPKTGANEAGDGFGSALSAAP